MTELSHIADNIERINNEIAKAAQTAGRDSSSITLIAVTKTYPVEYVTAAVHAGAINAGENRIQEAVPKIEALANDLSLSMLRWHLIGHLQTNKAKQAVEHFELIHSLDSLRLAREINKHAAVANRLMPVLMQINVSGEESKGGFPAIETEQAARQILNECSNITVRGFMTMAPLDSPETARPVFKALRELRDDIQTKISHPRFDPVELSMGMSNDFHVAIEEGATMIRIGTAIFGKRDYPT